MKKVIPDHAAISRFIKTLFRHATRGTYFQLCAFPEKGREGKPKIDRRKLGKLDDFVAAACSLADWASERNTAYVCCPPVATFQSASSAKANNLAEGLVLSVELDREPRIGRKRLEKVLGPATVCVASGGKFIDGDRVENKLHMYWRLKSPTKTAAEHSTLKLARKLATDLVDGDGTNVSIVHPIRLAGTPHRKAGKGVLSRIVYLNGDVEVSLKAALKKLKAASPTSEARKSQPSPAPVRPLDGGTVGRLMSQVLSGANYHESLASLAMHYALQGMSATSIQENLAGAMHAVPEAVRDLKDGVRVAGRWAGRLAEIPAIATSACDKVAAGSAWLDPEPLPDRLPSVPALDPLWLPEKLRTWATEIAERMQTPLDYVACSALVAGGAAVGSKIGIKPKPQTMPDWVEFPTNWGCIVGRPGILKSPAMRAAVAPLQALEDKATIANGEAEHQHRRAMAAHALRQKAAQSRATKALRTDIEADISEFVIDAPTAPAKRRHIVNDATPEALAEILAANPRGVLYFRDELTPFLTKLEDDRHADLRGQFLSAWSGHETQSSDRIARGHTGGGAHCLSLLGSTQPKRFAQYIRAIAAGKNKDDGLLQRFGLLVYPDVDPELREPTTAGDLEAKSRARATFNRLYNFDPLTVGAAKSDSKSAPTLTFDAEAQKLFDKWRRKNMARTRSGALPDALSAHLSKYPKLVSALALLFHLIDGKGGPVSVQAMKMARHWAVYLEAHAVRIYSDCARPEVEGAQVILDRIRDGKLKAPFTERELTRKNWRALTDDKVVKQALQVLWECHVVRRRKDGGTYVFDINPKVLSESSH